MSAVKMGLTIEEAAECTGIGRNTMRKLVEWGAQDHYPQGHAGTVSDGQSGKKSSEAR